MWHNSNFQLPIGYVGIINENNVHDVPKGTKFRVIGYPGHGWDYKVEFIGKFKGKKHINKSGPYVKHKHIELPKNVELLYGLK